MALQQEERDTVFADDIALVSTTIKPYCRGRAIWPENQPIEEYMLVGDFPEPRTALQFSTEPIAEASDFKYLDS